MPKRGSWRTILKYAAGIAVLAASVTAAWFLPGWYAGWQDARLSEQAVLSHRDSIAFLDTGLLDSIGRLELLEQQADSLTWDPYQTAVGNILVEDAVDRCRNIMSDWCAAGLFPEACLQAIFNRSVYLAQFCSVYLEDTALPVWFVHFSGENGYEVTLVMDCAVDLIYYASVAGSPMLDEIAADLGYESFEAFAKYEFRALEEIVGLPMDDEVWEEIFLDDIFSDGSEVYTRLQEECTRYADPVDVGSYDFAAVCGAEEMQASRGLSPMELDVRLTFETFTGHAYRSVTGMDYRYPCVGFAVMYGTDTWKYFVRDVAYAYGLYEEPNDSEDLMMDWYRLGMEYAAGTDVREELRYPWPGEAGSQAAAEAEEAFDGAAVSDAGPELPEKN